jgi:uncharacterized protein YfaS (alpha-2-macroglobulin family)
MARRLLALAFLLLPSLALAEPTVTVFSPQGQVKAPRQVRATFSEAMIPLGDPRRAADPFVVECPEKGTAHWEDDRTWSFDFDRDLPAGVRCRYAVRPGLKTLAGAAVHPAEFAFTTGGPAIVRSNPWEGSEWIAEDQVFLLTLDAGVRPESVVAHVGFEVEDVPERIGVTIVEGERLKEILKALRARGREDEDKPKRTRRLLAIAPRRHFPNATKVKLVWGKGVETASGVATTRHRILAFKTRPAFAAKFHCQRTSRKAGCLPITPMSVGFTAPVARERALETVVEGPDGRRWKARPRYEGEDTHLADVVFDGPFPESAGFRIVLSPDLRDDAGRTLLNAGEYPLAVRTDEYPPLAKFPARFGILESRDPVLPVTLRNVEPEVAARMATLGKRAGEKKVEGLIAAVDPDDPVAILAWLKRVGGASRKRSVFGPGGRPAATPKRFAVPKPGSDKPMEVVGIPIAKPGLWVVELESPRLGTALLDPPAPMYVPTAALVTNLGVHLKWGIETSLVWVTTLDGAVPVKGAKVKVARCSGAVLAEAETDADGIARLKLPSAHDLAACTVERPPLEDENAWRDYEDSSISYLERGVLVTARLGNDLGLVHSSWEDGIEPYRFDVPVTWQGDGPLLRTIFDRPLFRAGETVSMKHVFRTRSLAGFGFADAGTLPKTMEIAHLGSDEKHELKVEWREDGSAESAWTIPRDAKLGTWQVWFGAWPRRWTSGEFRVGEFRVPLMKAVLQAPATPQIAVERVPLDLALQYMAGGPAAKAPVVVRAQLGPWEMPEPKAFAGFTFANGGVTEGRTRRRREAPAPTPKIHQREQLTLDDAGSARTAIERLPKPTQPTRLLTEMEYRDPNGVTQTAAATTTLWPAMWLPGLKTESWASSSSEIETRVGVVNFAGTPVADAPVSVDVFSSRIYSHRKRLVGGFYAYDHVEEVKRLGTLCTGRTDKNGRLPCKGAAPASGRLVLVATVTDREGRTASAHDDVFVRGKDRWWFPVEDSDRMDVLPEEPRYEPGQTARFQVRMPFAEATALVTIEREGVGEARVVRLSGTSPVIELPVAREWAPNVFVSVLAVRGRIGDVQPTAKVDLGRPAFKLGVAEIKVGWSGHELVVTMMTDRAAYRVRDRAEVSVRVRTPDGSTLPPGSEVAFAAVDEGLLALRPNESWNLLDAMMARRSWGVSTSTAQMQVVGKRHFGLKAVPQGGGGGRGMTRELFDTLLLWKGRVPLDASGSARVSVPLNDSLTAFRLVAVATSGADRFGTGTASIRSTQDLMVLPGVSPLARVGDAYRTEFTVRNTTDRPMEADVSAAVEGLGAALPPSRVSLAPGEARVVGWDVVAPDVPELGWTVSATAAAASDEVRVRQSVRPATPVRVYQATLLRASRDEPIRQVVERPADAIAGRGGIDVALGRSLVTSLDGVRRWLGSYIYTCLEQRVSKAVALEDAAAWKAVVASLPAHQDADGLLKYFPTMTSGSDVLTSYVLSVTRAAGFDVPDDVRTRMEDGLEKFVTGAITRASSLPTADLTIRKLAALEALSRVGRARAGLVTTLDVEEPGLWPTSALIDWWSVVQRIPNLPERAARLAAADQALRARTTYRGSLLGFSTEERDGLWWLMVGVDSNAVRMVLAALEFGAWKEDLPRLVRGAIGRQTHGAWDTTVANVWGTLAVKAFSAAYEKEAVGGATEVALDAGEAERVTWSKADPAPVSLPWPPAGPGTVTVRHDGPGAPWAVVSARAAIPLAAPMEHGYRIVRSVTPVEARVPGRLSRGDVVRVRLEVEAQQDMTWVVVNDPIPAGATHLGTGLGGESAIAVSGERPSDWWSGGPTFVERALDGYRGYFEWVPKGRFVAEYTVRLNQSGTFVMPATRVEALYAPDVYGEAPVGAVEVAP